MGAFLAPALLFVVAVVDLLDKAECGEDVDALVDVLAGDAELVGKVLAGAGILFEQVENLRVDVSEVGFNLIAVHCWLVLRGATHGFRFVPHQLQLMHYKLWYAVCVMQTTKCQVTEWTTMADTDPADDTEWTQDKITATLLEMNTAITADGIDEVMLSGNIGYHIFAENDAENPMVGFKKTMHVAFDRAMQECFLDEEIVRDTQGDVTPETICAELERQLEQFMGHGGLQKEFLAAVGEEMGVEPDYMSQRLFATDKPAEVF